MSPTHPIEAELARMNSVITPGYGPLMFAGPQPAEQGWLATSKLIGNPGLVDLVLDQVKGVSSKPPLNIRAEWMLERYAWTIGVVASAFYVGSLRLPRMSPDLVMFRGYADAVSLISPELLALPGDPEISHPDLVEIADRDTLSDVVSQGMVAHLEPLISSMVELKSRPARALWRAAGDKIAESIDFSGTIYGDKHRADELKRSLLGGDGPLSNPLETDLDEHGHEYHLRVSCCLAYRTPEGGYCRACPLNRR